MSILDDVKKWMNFFGWTDGGQPGSVKKNDVGKIIAHHGDATWIEDVQDAIDRKERANARAELERRAASR